MATNTPDPSPLKTETAAAIAPAAEMFTFASLRADDEQQQQQQQQQQGHNTVRRYIDAATQRPVEQTVSTLTSQVTHTNQVVPKTAQ